MFHEVKKDNSVLVTIWPHSVTKTPQAMKFKTLQEPFLLNITIDLVGIMPQNYEDIYTCILFC